ncbi:MAG: TlyA family RNA methyltransferase [Nitrospirae bacterium]|nr:TlyA family RNA methyltransferase [Nitrospirota bacterium]
MPALKSKVRLDCLLVERGLSPTREKAAALILEGLVYVDGRRAEKAGFSVLPHASLELKGTLPYVSRGGQKLKAALQSFGIDVRGKTVLDVGASTGGFTDCLLQEGARRVYSVDVGYGQLDWRLRQDPRVIPFERTHILELDWNRTEFQEMPVEMATLDLSFISLTKVLAVFHSHLPVNGVVLALVKPQFEVGKGRVGKGGIVRDPEQRRQAVMKIVTFAQELGFRCQGSTQSPISGQKGNIEFFICLLKPEETGYAPA